MIRKVMTEKLHICKGICGLILEVRETDMSRLNELKKNKEFRELNPRYGARNLYLKRLRTFDSFLTNITYRQIQKAFDIYKRDILQK